MIQIVKGKERAYKYESISLAEGSVLNGAILNGEEIVSKLKEQKKKLGKVTLIIDSSNVMIKTIQAPKLSKKKLLGMVKSEFDLGEGYEYIYDMNILTKVGKENIVLGCAVPKDFLEKYIAIFKEARIKVLRIDVAVNGLIKYVNQVEAFKDKTCLINIVYGNTLLSLLFENGIYKLSNRNRMFNEQGTEGYSTELFTKFSTTVQYGQSQDTEERISHSYYIGVDGKTMRYYTHYVKSHDPNLIVESYNDMDRNMEYMYPLTGEFVNKEDIDLKSIQKITAKTKRNYKGIILKTLFLGVLFVPFVLYSQKLASDNATAQKEIDALQTYITAKEEANANAEETALDSDGVNNEIAQYSWVVENIENSRMLSPEMLDAIYGGDATVESLVYDESGNTVTFTGYADSQADVVQYSGDLREEGYSDAQYYSGYSVTSGESSDSYYFSIEAIWNAVESEGVLDGEDE